MKPLRKINIIIDKNGITGTDTYNSITPEENTHINKAIVEYFQNPEYEGFSEFLYIFFVSDQPDEVLETYYRRLPFEIADAIEYEYIQQI